MSLLQHPLLLQLAQTRRRIEPAQAAKIGEEVRAVASSEEFNEQLNLLAEMIGALKGDTNDDSDPMAEMRERITEGLNTVSTQLGDCFLYVDDQQRLCLRLVIALGFNMQLSDLRLNLNDAQISEENGKLHISAAALLHAPDGEWDEDEALHAEAQLKLYTEGDALALNCQLTGDHQGMPISHKTAFDLHWVV